MKQIQIEPIHHPERMSSYWRKEWKVVFLIFIFGIGFNGAVSLGPILQGVLIDGLIQQASFIAMLPLVGTFLMTLILIQAMRYFKRYYVRRFSNKTSASMRMMIYNHLIHEEFSMLQKESSGDLMIKAVQDVDLCVEGMRKVTTEVFDTGVLMLSYFVALFVYDWKMTLLACLSIPLSLLVAERMKKMIVAAVKKARQQSSHVADLAFDAIEHDSLYRILGQQSKNLQQFDDALMLMKKKTIKAELLENTMQPVYNIIAMAGLAVVFFFGVNNVFVGIWSVGTFSACITMFIALALKASKAGKLFNSFQKAKVSWQRIQPYLKDYVSQTEEVKTKETVEGLRVTDLSFTYPNRNEPVFENCSFVAHRGEIIGITGPVACGKSTLGWALQGLAPYQGKILIDGVELSSIATGKRASLLGYFSHQPQLFNQSIQENIQFGESGSIESVLKQVAFEQDLAMMPDRENTQVGHRGFALSGGQQARIALARTLFRQPPILVLDDPFAAVDKNTEALIFEQLKEIAKDAIVILISHRLTYFDLLNQVILMHEEGTIETGTHAALLKKSTLYKELVDVQQRGNLHEK